MLEFLSLNLSSLLYTVIGAVAGFFITYFLTSKKELIYAINYGAKIENSMSEYGVKIFIDNLEVESLRVSKVVIFNSGDVDIKGEDIKEEIAIIVAHSKIVRQEVFRFSRLSNNIRVEDGKILFDYLNSKDGFVIKVFHDSVESSALDVKGRLIGINKIEKRNILPPKALIIQAGNNSIFPFAFFDFIGNLVSKFNYRYRILIINSIETLFLLIGAVFIIYVIEYAIPNMKVGKSKEVIQIFAPLALWIIVVMNIVNALIIFRKKKLYLSSELEDYFNE